MLGLPKNRPAKYDVREGSKLNRSGVSANPIAGVKNSQGYTALRMGIAQGVADFSFNGSCSRDVQSGFPEMEAGLLRTAQR